MKSKCRIDNIILAVRENDVVTLIDTAKKEKLISFEKDVLYLFSYVLEFLIRSESNQCSEILFDLEHIPGFIEYNLVVEGGVDFKKVQDSNTPVFFVKLKNKKTYKIGYKTFPRRKKLSVSLVLNSESILALCNFISLLNEEEGSPYEENEPMYNISHKNKDFEITESEVTIKNVQFDRDEFFDELYLPFKRFSELLEMDVNALLETHILNEEIVIILEGKEKFVNLTIKEAGHIKKIQIKQSSFKSVFCLIENFWVYGIKEFATEFGPDQDD